MGPEVAAASSIASLAFSAGSSIYKGFGEKATQEFLAARDQRAAEIGRIRADQFDVQKREELNTTLANIDAIRAASNIDYLSPTTAAIKTEETRVADRERTIGRSNLLAQAREDELSAQYRGQ